MNERTGPARGRPRTFSVEAVLDAAVGVFWARGYAGASISDLTAATGLAPPSLYAAFGSKRGIFLAALDRYAETCGAGPVRALAAAPAAGKAAALAEATVALCFPDDRPCGCLIACVGAEAAAGDAAIRRHVGALFARSIAALDAARAGSTLEDGEVLLAALQAGAVRARAGATPDEVRALVARLAAPR